MSLPKRPPKSQSIAISVSGAASQKQKQKRAYTKSYSNHLVPEMLSPEDLPAPLSSSPKKKDGGFADFMALCPPTPHNTTTYLMNHSTTNTLVSPDAAPIAAPEYAYQGMEDLEL